MMLNHFKRFWKTKPEPKSKPEPEKDTIAYGQVYKKNSIYMMIMMLLLGSVK